MRCLSQAFANRVGEEPTRRFIGDSILSGPMGETYTVLDEAIEGYAVATIDLDRVRQKYARIAS